MNNKKNLFIGIIVAFVILAISAGLVLFNMIRQDRISELVSSSTEVLSEAEAEISKRLSKYEVLIESLANDVDVRSINESEISLRNFDMKLTDLLTRNEEILYIYLGTEDKDMFLRPLTDLPDSYDPSARPWYIDAVANNSITWSQPYQDASTGENIITVSSPVKVLGTSELLGVVSMDLSLDYVISDIKNIVIGDMGYAVVCTKDGITIYHPNQDLIGVGIPVPEILKMIQNTDQSSLEYRFDGELKYALINRIDDTDLVLLGLMDSREISSSTSKFLINYISISLIIFLSLLLGLVQAIKKDNESNKSDKTKQAKEFKFKDFDLLTDKVIDLVIKEKTPENRVKGFVPAYIYDIKLHNQDDIIGDIDIRIGYNSNISFGGHIGYNIDEKYRGNGYATKAVTLITQVARAHGMKRLRITCNPNNFPSRRVCEKAGFDFKEIVDLPSHNDMYLEGERQKCIYELTL